MNHSDVFSKIKEQVEAQRETLQKIQAYATEARERQDHVVDFDASSIEHRLAQTVRELQARVQEQQAALEQLRSKSNVDLEAAAYASEDPRQKLQQLIAVKDAYRRLKPTATYLPGKESALPALLAARTLQQGIRGTKESIADTKSQFEAKEAALQREEANLHDANQLTQAMEARIERLRAQHADRSQKTPAHLARELIAAKRAQKDAYDADMQRLGQAMNDFINDYLSNMLAAEELGGPVVGDMLDVEDDVLAAGFTKKGRAKSTKKPVSDKMRQRRIDQIWGKQHATTAGADNEVAEEVEEEPPTEAEAADAEMRQLIENLFATLVGPGGGKAYFQLQRDSAASRFLVRAKIAQFHPRDARKLRLIDFGRELDD
ncbi:Centromere Cenp-K [Pyrenophora seminiperda CCB06]|uniref:Centromere Cenp-K n=1 Tax=Pyrenophora seminiperda CCB06 TaxID=1302712 RepID=A0A3M7M8A6_9PLEO|nr:Centromere Cenp-K [Pyrenophora seminiperda CCB06]